MLNVYGSSNKKGNGAGFILEGRDQITLQQAIRFNFETSNNQDEYEALIAILNLAQDMRVKKLKCYNDSQLVTSQINGEYQAKELILQKYYHIAKRLIEHFDKFEAIHVPELPIAEHMFYPSSPVQRKLDNALHLSCWLT